MAAFMTHFPQQTSGVIVMTQFSHYSIHIYIYMLFWQTFIVAPEPSSGKGEHRKMSAPIWSLFFETNYWPGFQWVFNGSIICLYTVYDLEMASNWRCMNLSGITWHDKQMGFVLACPKFNISPQEKNIKNWWRCSFKMLFGITSLIPICLSDFHHT